MLITIYKDIVKIYIKIKYNISLYKDKIKKGGHLIIEDIQNDNSLNEIIKTIDTINYDYKVYDLRKVKNRYDDIIIDIIKK